MENQKSVTIDNVEYIKADSIKAPAEGLNGMEYVIVRSYASGCFAGYMESKKDREVILRKARRLWYWSGASSLSQLAMEGVKNPSECKFPCEVDKIIIDDVGEVISTTEEAKKSIKNVDIWEQ